MNGPTDEETERRHRLDNLIAAVHMLTAAVEHVRDEQKAVRAELEAVVERLDRMDER